MVTQHYRWDFVGLSTDTKPTPETSEKVVDGSTFYCSDTSKLYVFCKDTWYERKALGSGGGGTTYTAGDGIDITNDTISVDTDTIQPKLTAGSNVSISDNTISATDTTYSNFTGTDGTAGGTAGLVPAPATTDAGKFLKADGTWDSAGGGGPTIVQTTGSSTTDVMSQDAVTKMVYNSPSQLDRIRIGENAQVTSGLTVAIGDSASVSAPISVAIGYGAHAGTSDSVALGSYSETTKYGQIHIGVTNSNHGHNNTYYRLLSGVYDGEDAHDAVTVNQINALIDAINSATNSNIPHIGS